MFLVTRPRCRGVLLAGWLISALYAFSVAAGESDFAAERAAMVDDIVIYTDRANAGGIDKLSEKVLSALRQVGRHEFIPTNQIRYAYENRPLPIGFGQTISQPYIVGLMTHLVDPEPTDAVLEIGTGSGYQAAVLAKLVDRVFSIEIIERLADRATTRLANLGYSNVTSKLGDGYYGWPEHGPFDSIVVTAAASHVPPPLIEQLKPGGRMVIPVGGRFMTQQLLLIEKMMDGAVVTRQITAVRFVPLTGEH